MRAGHPALRPPGPGERRGLLLALASAALAGCASRGDTGPAGQSPSSAGPAASAPDMSAFALDRPVGATVADRGSAHYRFEGFGLDSADGQRHYRIRLAIPLSSAPAAASPLVVMLDGNVAFGALTEADLADPASIGAPPVIAAIGYDTPLGVDVDARAYDYTPPVPGEAPTWDDRARGRRGGGADVFLDLWQQRIGPAIDARVAIDPARRTLWGHSYGGLLALYALLTRPALFGRYAAADPSLWWHGGFILDVERRAAPLPPTPTALLLMAGSAATDVEAGTRALRPGLDPAVVEAARERRRAVPPDATERLAERLATRPGLEVTWLPFPGVGHGPLRAASIPPTLAFATR